MDTTHAAENGAATIGDRAYLDALSENGSFGDVLDFADNLLGRLERVTSFDAGPHERCRRCGGANVVWFAPSPLWNLVMRENDINGPIQFGDLVCIPCFIGLAAEKGVQGVWRIGVDPEPEGLVKITPSGRVWNEETHLWDEPTTRVTPPGADA